MSSLERERPEKGPFPLKRIWVSPAGSNSLSLWGEQLEEPKGSFFIDVHGIRGSIFEGATILYCLGKPVARVTEICSELGAFMFQLEVVPEVAAQKIDDKRILDKITEWCDSRKEGTLVCAEIAGACTEFGINGHTAEAAKLYTYLKRTGWSPN